MLDVRGHKFLLSAWDLMFGALPQTQIIKSCWALSSTSGFLTIFLVLVCFQNLQPPHEQVCSPACFQPNCCLAKNMGPKKKPPAGRISAWMHPGDALLFWGREAVDIPWRLPQPLVGFLSLAVDIQSHAVHKQGRTSQLLIFYRAFICLSFSTALVFCILFFSLSLPLWSLFSFLCLSFSFLHFAASH